MKKNNITGNNKQLSNPFSTGGGGFYFETRVQASFVTLMLARGFVPCLPNWPITKIKLQGKYEGYETDDMIIFVKESDGNRERKLLCQIKQSIGITRNNDRFAEVIQAAWSDFNNVELFTKNEDKIALITGPLSATDIDHVRPILELARHSADASEFFNKVKKDDFSSQKKKDKLRAFRTNLDKANGGQPVPEETVFHFLKHFHLLGYDLDIEAGVHLSLLHSSIDQYSQENAQALWSRVVDAVQSHNQNAGTITRETLPEDLVEAFQVKEPIKKEKISKDYLPALEIPVKRDWNRNPVKALVFANLAGAWDESNDGDREVIEQLTQGDYTTWIDTLREVLQLPDSPVSLKNGHWRVKAREDLWKEMGEHLFDEHLEHFKELAIKVLKERDPKFDLPVADRFAANIYGKKMHHSRDLRKGMAESLALIGCRQDDLKRCSFNKPGHIAILAVREIFEGADWLLWGSLDDLLPILAEASADEFLDAVDQSLKQMPCPFDELFSQEDNGFTGQNYLTGLLWALEGLAWDEELFVRVMVVLGELAHRDPGGNGANRPINSLRTILLPWRPQTTAPFQKHRTAIKTLQDEAFVKWFEHVRSECDKSGHLGVALSRIGQVLFHCPPDPGGFFINKEVAGVLNRRDAEGLRRGYYLKVLRARGDRIVDPTGKPERELAEKYRQKADEIEDAGYHRFAQTSRDLAKSYDDDAARTIDEHGEKQKGN